MVFLGFVILVWLFFAALRHLRQIDGTGSPHGDWAKQRSTRRDAGKRREWQRGMRRWERAQRKGKPVAGTPPTPADISAWSLRKRTGAEAGFYIHLLTYLGVIALLAFINLLSGSSTAWFLWPAAGWGFGLFAHWMGVFGRHAVLARYVEPAVEREVQREKAAMHTEKQADIGELSATIAHEIRNPIAAAKSLVQQMAEDPHSIENTEYGRVAVDELDRVERRIAHLLRYAREEDYAMAPVSIATVVDAALTQLRAKLDAGRVQPLRHYIAGPTVRADAEKLQGVFANVIDNAVDVLAAVAEPRRVELFIENGGAEAVVRIRDSGPGLDAEKLAQIFNPFFTTKDHGTGLGLAIAKKTVEAHGGTMTASSAVGQGTEFVVTLPLPR